MPSFELDYALICTVSHLCFSWRCIDSKIIDKKIVAGIWRSCKILFPNVLVELEAYEMRVTSGQSLLPPELKTQHWKACVQLKPMIDPYNDVFRLIMMYSNLWLIHIMMYSAFSMRARPIISPPLVQSKFVHKRSLVLEFFVRMIAN